MVFDSRLTAKEMLLESGLQSNVGSVSSLDKQDFYRFQVSSTSRANLSLSGLSADASLTLMDRTGRSLAVSNRTGNSAESINTTLVAGTYYIAVSQVSGNSTYKLNLASNEIFANINDSISWLMGDFNGDGLEDALRQEQGSLVDGVNDVQFLLRKADGSFQSAMNITNMAALSGNGSNLITGDFNGDGKTDLIRQAKGVWVNGDNNIQILTFKGANFEVAANFSNLDSWNGNFVNLIAGDFNADGRTDLIRQEKGSWVDGQWDAQLVLSQGGWSFSSPTTLRDMALMTGNNVLLVANGTDVMRLETGTWVNGSNDVQFASFVNGDFSTLSNSPTDAFNQAIVAKPWEQPIEQAYEMSFGGFLINQATPISPYGTTGRYSSYEFGDRIYWSAKTGAKKITAEMQSIFNAFGGSGGWLGMPTTQQYAWSGGIRQDFEGGYLFKDALQAVALRSNQQPMFAPKSLTINGIQGIYNTNSTIQLGMSYVSDLNGWTDIARIDFWLENTSRQRIELSDVATFSRSTDLLASFQAGISLNGITAGNYTLKAIAYDKSGITGGNFSQVLSIVSSNVAPTSLQINGLQSTYDSGSTLNLYSGYVWDQNGWTDISRVDFWLTDSQNRRIELSDVTNFISFNANWAQFSYSTSLAGLNAGSYKLCAIAYDKSGAASTNSLAQDFSILRTKDWFDLNLKDSSVTMLARNAAADRDLSRNEMLGIFRNIQDGGLIDSIELADMNTLLNNVTGSLFSMKENVAYLTSKVVSETVVNMQASTFDFGVMGKWFLGTIAPKAEFLNTSENKYYSFQYQQFSGSLFGGSSQARISGIDQRQFGDCVLLASIGATFAPQSGEWGRSSQVVNQMLIDNGDQTYTVRFFNENKGLQAEWVTVDSRLVTFGGSLFGASNQDGLFMPIIEKAYAQWREWTVNDGQSGWTIIGNGDYINAGLQRIVGRSAQLYWNSTDNSGYTFEMIQQALSQGKAVSSGSTSGLDYLVSGHAYSVTNAYLSLTGQKRVVVYNPWGMDGGKVVQGSEDGFVDLSFEEFRTFQNIAIA